jgi:carboxyl-terminal processing protease
VVVGQQTYGKGTVQNLYPLDRYAPGNDPRFGQLTLTVGKYYRVTGGSTQHKGVVPDIVLPSPIDAHMIGESTQDSALPWDQISPTPFDSADSVAATLEVLAASHEQRASEDPDLQFLLNDIEAQEAIMDRTSVSLNLETRRQENERFEAERLARENARRQASGLEPLASVEAMEAEDPPDVVLKEAARIAADLSGRGPAPLASADPAGSN